MKDKIEVLLSEMSKDLNISFTNQDISNIDKVVNLSDVFLSDIRGNNFKVPKYVRGTMDDLYVAVSDSIGLLISKKEFESVICDILSRLYNKTYNVIKKELLQIKDEIDIVLVIMIDLLYDPYGPGFNKSAKKKVINPGGERSTEGVLDSIEGYEDILDNFADTWYKYFLDPPKSLNEVIEELGADSDPYTVNVVNVIELVEGLNKNYDPENIIETISSMYRLNAKQQEGLRSIIEYESNRRNYDDLRYD